MRGAYYRIQTRDPDGIWSQHMARNFADTDVLLATQKPTARDWLLDFLVALGAVARVKLTIRGALNFVIRK